MPVIFILRPSTSFPDPGNWGPVNKIECIGSGAHGGTADAPPFREGEPEPQAIVAPGAGGGGGGYAYQNNVPTPTFPVSLRVAMGGTAGTGSPSPANTWWLASDGGTPNSVQAGAARVPNLNAGGAGGLWWAPNGSGFDGGYGGHREGLPAYLGSGGGGAAGPHGAGNAGGVGSIGTVGRGGSADGGWTAPPDLGTGAWGVSGTQWDASHGCGSGGSGGSGSVAAGHAGYYGGGGGGQGPDDTGASNGAGRDGMIVITYTPYVAPTEQARAMIMV